MGYANYNKAMFFAVHQCHDAHFALFGKTRLLITCHQQQQQQQTIKNSRYIKNEFLPCFYPLPNHFAHSSTSLFATPTVFSLCILLLMGSICFSIHFFFLYSFRCTFVANRLFSVRIKKLRLGVKIYGIKFGRG